MTDSIQREILLIWVNAERQFEREFVAALGSSDFFSEPRVTERDARQAEIAAWVPDMRDILEAIIDALYELSDFDIRVQGAEKERLPTVVFSAEPTRDERKRTPQRRVRRHVDAPQDDVEVTHRSRAERVLSTSEMAAQAQASAPMPRRISAEVVDEREHIDGGLGGTHNATRRRKTGDGLIPRVVKIAKLILIEEEPGSEEQTKSEHPAVSPPVEEGEQSDE